MKRLLACLLVIAAALPASAQAVYETQATAAYVVDLGTNTVLLEKNPDQPLPPASMPASRSNMSARSSRA